MPPRVTVIISTYNWSTVLPYSIGSVLSQTDPDFELLVVGDGCTDDSEQVVTAIEDSRVRWINLPKGTGHQSGPNNEGLRQARGELIAYLGHDDLWLPHHLASHVASLENGTDWSCSIFAAVAPDGNVSPQIPREDGRGWMAPSAVVHRRGVTETIGGWRDYRGLSLGPEDDLWRRALAAGFEFEFVRRLTGIKFPASTRPAVYRERPCHEQAAWLRRIETEPNLEIVELSNMVASLNRRFLFGIGGRLGRLLKTPSQWPSFIWRRNGARIKSVQRFKGVDRVRSTGR